MFLFRFQACLVVLTAMIICRPAEADESVDQVDEKLLANLQGEWVPVFSTFDGKESKVDQEKRASFVIEHRTMSIRFQDQVVGKFEIKHLVAKESLGHIDYEGLNPAGETVRIKQLFKLEGDKLTTCVIAPPGGGDRPIELASPTGSKQLMTVSERRKKDEPKRTSSTDDGWELQKKQLAKIKTEYKAVQTAASNKTEAALNSAKREAAILEYLEELNRNARPLIEKAFAIVQPHAGYPEAAAELTWIIESCPGSETANRAAELLGKYHLTSESTTKLPARYSLGTLAWTEPLLRKLVDADLPREKKAQALLQLAQCVQAQSTVRHIGENSEDRVLKTIELQVGKQFLAQLRSADTAELEQEALRLFRDACERYGDVSYGGKTIADYAMSAIYEIENLGIGKTAPDIAGEDVDGVAFKLSDYRGKVVLLDFWDHGFGGCRAMYPRERSLVNRLQGQPFVIIGVNCDPQRESLKKVMENENITWRSFWDRGGPAGPITTKWNILARPTFFLIDHKGVIRAKGGSGMALDRLVDELVAKTTKSED